MKTLWNIIKSTTCTLLILPVISSLSLRAQDHYITFSGRGASMKVDSVIVENLTQGTMLEMKGSDTLHLIPFTTGIEENMDYEKGKIFFYPNPMKENTRMQFILPEDGETIISLYDISGREKIQIRDLLSAGKHTYELKDIETGIYFVRISCRRYSTSGILISSGSQHGGVKITYENTENPQKQEVSKGKKNDSDGTCKLCVVMEYNMDDRLKFTGTSDDFRSVTISTPSSAGGSYFHMFFPFEPCSDGDGNEYSTVKIGEQIWMGENLKTTLFKTGSTISNVVENAEWIGMTGPAYCWYDNNINNKNDYGALYNWHAVTDPRLCPLGYHVPTSDDWVILENYLVNMVNGGGKLKETGTTHWLNPNLGATNESGFTALPGGYRDGSFTSVFNGLNKYGFFWSSSSDQTVGIYRVLDYNKKVVNTGTFPKAAGLSVRCLKTNLVTDYDGNPYTTLRIGNQIWMVENLRTTHYNDGTVIPTVVDPETPFYCWYGDDEVSYKNIYGALYNWHAVNTGKLCPAGWHVPAESEWTILSTYLGGENEAGGKLKETGSDHWHSPNTGATNEAGFTALPGGKSDAFNGTHHAMGEICSLWSATEASSTNAWYREISYDSESFTRTSDNGLKHGTKSVRCLKDNLDIVKDIDGNSYSPVVIGNQVWMGENLRTTHLTDGTPIPIKTNPAEWKTLETPGCCWYENNEANKNIYGVIYNWHTVNTGKLCPTGWHVPSDADWTTLTTYLGGESLAGGFLKEGGTAHWQSPNTGATNQSGFTALPGGSLDMLHDLFMGICNDCVLWSSTKIDDSSAWYRKITYNQSGIDRNTVDNRYGAYVRCVKD